MMKRIIIIILVTIAIIAGVLKLTNSTKIESYESEAPTHISQKSEIVSDDLSSEEVLLTESIWISTGTPQIEDMSKDSLYFKSEKDVDFYMGELSWGFDSKYEVVKDTLIIKSILSAFELENVDDMHPDFIQTFIIMDDTLKPVEKKRFNYASKAWQILEINEKWGNFIRIK